MEDPNYKFRSIEEIPLPYRKIFEEYPCFNIVQSQVLDDVLYSDKSIVVSSPTGSGKTVIFELAIVKLLMQNENAGHLDRQVKVVYISPIKSLCHERLVDWHQKFSPFGLNCVAITGDSDNMDFQSLVNHHLIVSTPEKWDSLTRRWRDNEKIVKVVKLFMIDEVHLLNEENRGSTLEVVVSRMKTMETSLTSCMNGDNQRIRFIAVSATIPNVDDIADWIGKSTNTKFFRFSETLRPVKLNKIVLGYNYSKNMSPFKFDLFLNYKLQSLLMQYSEGKPTLIFCSTRKSVEMTAKQLILTLKIYLNHDQIKKLQDVANSITDANTRETLKHGVGYHHAGMIPETRHAIEEVFRRGDLPVLVTTSTLAMGVNLPAHLVIVKSTKYYDNGGFRDYSETAIHQMIGRAGRPQFDTNATALILTTNEDKQKFENMIGCTQPIESNLHRHLTEHLNAEAVLRTITDLGVAMQWLASTFLYVRARKNPRHYGLHVGLSKEQIDKKLLEICQIDLNKLVKAGMLTIDQDINITPTMTGQIMAKYYVAFETMKLFTQISGTEILIQILALVSKCHEFSEMRPRVNEKKLLNMFNKNSSKRTIRFPLNGKIKTCDMKVNCIIQAVLGNLDISDHSILTESFSIMRNGSRIVECLIDYLGTRRTNCYSALLNTIILGKCFHAKLWENSPYVSKQLSGIGSVLSNHLVNAGKVTFQKILESNPRDIEVIIKRRPPVGNQLLEEVRRIPKYTMNLEPMPSSMECKKFQLRINLENFDDLVPKSTIDVKSVMSLLVGNNLNEILIYERYRHSYFMENTRVVLFVEINADAIGVEEIQAHFISEDWVGIDCNCRVTLQPKISKNNVPESGLANEPEDKSKEPTYIQTFLDMYMKITKNKQGNNNSKKCSEKEQIQQATSNSDKPIKKGRTKNIVKDDKKINRPHKGSSGENAEKSEKKFTNNKHIEKSNQIDFEDKHIQKIAEKVAESNTNFSYLEANEDITKKFQEFENIANKENTKMPKTLSDDLGECFNVSGSSLSPKLAKEETLNVKHPQETPSFQNLTEQRTYETNQQHAHADVIDLDESKAKISSHFDAVIKTAPSLFSMARKYLNDEAGQQSVINHQMKPGETTKKRKIEDIHPAEELELESLVNGNIRQELIQDKFKKPTKKKFSHVSAAMDDDNFPDSTVNNTRSSKQLYSLTEILEPSRKPSAKCLFSQNDESSSGRYQQKCIKWRSPLVFSPAIKFSPKISSPNSIFREDCENEMSDETLETSISSKTTNNLVLNIQKTPKHSIIKDKFNSSFPFPLCDNDYKDSRNATLKEKDPRQRDKLTDLCATQFLDDVMAPNNKMTPRHFKKCDPPTAVDYYSQLLPSVSKLQREKQRDETPNKQKVNREENKENSPPTKEHEYPAAARRQRDLNASQISFEPNIRDSECSPDTSMYSTDRQDFILSQNSSIKHEPVQNDSQINMNRTQENIDTRIMQNGYEIPHYPGVNRLGGYCGRAPSRHYAFGFNHRQAQRAHRPYYDVPRPARPNETMVSGNYVDRVVPRNMPFAPASSSYGCCPRTLYEYPAYYPEDFNPTVNYPVEAVPQCQKSFYFDNSEQPQRCKCFDRNASQEFRQQSRNYVRPLDSFPSFDGFPEGSQSGIKHITKRDATDHNALGENFSFEDVQPVVQDCSGQVYESQNFVRNPRYPLNMDTYRPDFGYPNHLAMPRAGVASIHSRNVTDSFGEYPQINNGIRYPPRSNDKEYVMNKFFIPSISSKSKNLSVNS